MRYKIDLFAISPFIVLAMHSGSIYVLIIRLIISGRNQSNN